MTKHKVQGFVMMALAVPLALGACGKSESSHGDAAVDGPRSVDGSRVDTGPAVDTAPSDGLVVTDTIPSGDTVPTDARPANPDVSVIDAPVTDAPQVPDAAQGDGAGIEVAMDTTPDTAVCTETTKFSGGAVTADRTLSKACSPYTIKSDIDVNGNATLTIEPGVTLRFDPDKNIAVAYTSAAKLMAVGTAAEPILFTSSAATPGAGDWAGVQLWSNTMNGTTIKYAKFDYCGSNSDACVLGTGPKPNRVTLDHVTFSHVGPGSDAIKQKDKDSNFTITGCTFNDIPTTPTQQYAISLYAPSFTGIDSTNVFNGTLVELMGGTVAANSAWKNVGTTVVVSDDVRVEGTATPVLTIAAGSVFKFANGVGLAIGYSNPGSLSMVGTATAPITLTSLAGTPGAGDWVGITLWYSATATIKYAAISFAGSDKGAIDVVSDTDKLDIQSSTITSSATYGIRIPCDSKASVVNTGNTFTACASGNVGPGPAGSTCH